jgi:hypothetical protein
MPFCKLSEGCFLNTDHVVLARFTIKNGAATKVSIMLPGGNEIELGKEHAEALHQVFTEEAEDNKP